MEMIHSRRLVQQTQLSNHSGVSIPLNPLLADYFIEQIILEKAGWHPEHMAVSRRVSSLDMPRNADSVRLDTWRVTEPPVDVMYSTLLRHF